MNGSTIFNQIGQMLRRFQNVKITCPARDLYQLSSRIYVCLDRFSRDILKILIIHRKMIFIHHLAENEYRDWTRCRDGSRHISREQRRVTHRRFAIIERNWHLLAGVVPVGNRLSSMAGWLAGWLAVPCRARPPVLAPLLFRVFDRSGRYDSTTRLSLESSLKTTTSLHPLKLLIILSLLSLMLIAWQYLEE